MRRVLGVVAVLALVGCGGAGLCRKPGDISWHACGLEEVTAWDWEPESAVGRPRVSALYARVAYRGDVPALAAVEGRPLGTLQVRGLRESVTQADLVRIARLEGAERGGTHVVRVERGAIAGETTVRGAGSATCWGQWCAASSSATAHTEQYAAATFLVIHVPADRWDELPRELRPQPRPAVRQQGAAEK